MARSDPRSSRDRDYLTAAVAKRLRKWAPVLAPGLRADSRLLAEIRVAPLLKEPAPITSPLAAIEAITKKPGCPFDVETS